MADIKISELPAASQMNDSDVLPIVQAQETKKVTKQILLSEVNEDITEIQNAGYITKEVNDLTNYYTKTEVDGKVSAVYKYKGSVATYADLPSTSLTIGDVYNVLEDGSNYAWTGTAWDKLGGDIDLSGYQLKIDSNNKLDSDLVDDTNQIHKFVSASEKAQITTNQNAIAGIKDGTTIDSFADVETALAGKQATLTFDTTPTESSTNPVTSGGIYTYVTTIVGDIETILTTLDVRKRGGVDEYCDKNNKYRKSLKR